MQIGNQLSRLRQSLGHLKKDLDSLLPVFCEQHPLRKGVAYVLRRRCGKENCYCVRGQKRHSSYVLSRSIEGRTRLRTVAKEEALEVRAQTRHYRRFRRARARLVKRFEKMLGVIDAIESLREQERRT